MAPTPRFESREEHLAWKQSHGTGGDTGVATLEPPPPGTEQRQPAPGTSARPRQPARPHTHPSQDERSARVYETIAGIVVVGALIAAGLWWMSWQSTGPDPRCRLDVGVEHRASLARFVNRSELWQTYLDHKQPSRKGASAVVAMKLTTERKARKSYGGDYDPGTVYLTFEVTNLGTGKTVYDRDGHVDLAEFFIGKVPNNATREQIQETVFKATEEKVLPYIHRWVELAAIHAMGQEGRYGTSFVSVLRALTEDRWTTEDKHAAAVEALRQIQG